MQPETIWLDADNRMVNFEAVRHQPDADGTRHHGGLTGEQLKALGYKEVTIFEKPDDYSEEFYCRDPDNHTTTGPYIRYTRKPDDQIAQILLAKAKQARHAVVDAIVVTTASGKQFDGNEAAQDRMARAVVAMDETDTTLWVLADNTPAQVSRAELREALRLAGQAQTEVWVTPYV